MMEYLVIDQPFAKTIMWLKKIYKITTLAVGKLAVQLSNSRENELKPGGPRIVNPSPPGTCRWRHSERAPHPHPSRAPTTSAWFCWGQKTEMKERDYWHSWHLWNRMRNERDGGKTVPETWTNVSSSFHLIHKLCTHRTRLHEARQTMLMGKRARTGARTGLRTSKTAARVRTPPGTPQDLVKQRIPMQSTVLFKPRIYMRTRGDTQIDLTVLSKKRYHQWEFHTCTPLSMYEINRTLFHTTSSEVNSQVINFV